MNKGLWGHALFLASKMDQRTYAGVMTRFANGLAVNDPLQTLYQLMSARMPSSMKYCVDQVILLYIYFACLVCLFVNKTAKPIGPKFRVRPQMTPSF